MVKPVRARICRIGLDRLILALDNLNPVAIGILDERNVLHAALGEFLLERVPGVLEPLARNLDVINGDSDVAEAAVGFLVAVGDAVVGVALRAVVVGEFEDTMAVCPVAVALEGLGARVCEEVEGEFVFGEVELLDLV
jgi:hypothetical protein